MAAMQVIRGLLETQAAAEAKMAARQKRMSGRHKTLRYATANMRSDAIRVFPLLNVCLLRVPVYFNH